MKKQYSPEEIKQANIEYHTKMVESYDNDQPHFKSGNVKRVDDIIKGLAETHNNGSLLDIGCGTGFILNIAKKYFNQVTGIDVTQAMLDKVSLSNQNGTLILAESSDMPFDDGSFDVCTAYSVLHHLPSLLPTFKEVSRCLKIGGTFYADQDPNYYCRRQLNNIKEGEYSEALENEIKSVRNIYSELGAKYDLGEHTVRLAEFQSLVNGGMKEESVINLLRKAGFSEVDFEYQWFLGEGYTSQEVAEHISKHLKKLLPLSKTLFKYVSFMARK